MADVSIPDDILHNILIRLPAKALLRFRCVSTYWNRMITDPYFMKSRSRRMIILPTSSVHLIDHNLPIDDPDHSINLRSSFPRKKGNHLSIVGTCNGIVLLVVTDPFQNPRLILYNPLTRSSKEVPDPPYPHYDATYVYGFGYGETPDELKIVRIEVHDDFYGDWNTYDVFDCKQSSWCTWRDFAPKYNFYRDVGGTHLNGVLYWVAHKKIDDVILALNVKEMVVSKIDVPDGCDCSLLGSVNGCLCVISENYEINLNRFDVWVMKEENSWRKTCSFRFGLEGNWRWCKQFFPVYILDDGRILMMGGSGQLFVYDTLKDSCKLVVVLERVKSFGMVYGVEYIESLVSP